MLESFSAHNEKVTYGAFKAIECYLKREDQRHFAVSGNKYYKLKLNLLEAKKQGFTQLLTFGGAHSNHIMATAFYARLLHIKAIGVVRGDELQNQIENLPTLSFAKACGMQLHCISRNDYKKREDQNFLSDLMLEHGAFYLIPEGGTNALGVLGCVQMLSQNDSDFDVICCPVGSGGTLAGLVEASGPHQFLLGFSALRNSGVENKIKGMTNKENWQLIEDDYFGGYAKITDELVWFMNDFYTHTGILLDPIYTGKMMFSIQKMLVSKKFLSGKKVLAIHTGGLQGVLGVNQRLAKKNRPILNYESKIIAAMAQYKNNFVSF